jgi:hypothetical protein
VAKDIPIVLQKDEGRRIKQQAQQKQVVPQDVILKMQSTLEPPTRGGAAWEAASVLRVSTTTGDNDNDDDDTNSFPNDEDILRFIQNCPPIVELPKMVGLSEEQVQVERAKTLENQRHTWDKRLRTWVGCVAKYDNRLAAKANAARKTVFQGLKKDEAAAVVTSEKDLIDLFVNLVLDGDKSSSLRSTLQSLLLEQIS